MALVTERHNCNQLILLFFTVESVQLVTEQHQTKTVYHTMAQDSRKGKCSYILQYFPKNLEFTEPYCLRIYSDHIDELRSPRARILWDKWRNVWQLAWERQRRLHDHLLHLLDLERVRNFLWDEWRKRFLKFMNHKKSRLTDLFRKMDKDNNGLIPRDIFMDGIIGTSKSLENLMFPYSCSIELKDEKWDFKPEFLFYRIRYIQTRDGLRGRLVRPQR